MQAYQTRYTHVRITSQWGSVWGNSEATVAAGDDIKIYNATLLSQ
jgi:hypothetical protein